MSEKDTNTKIAELLSEQTYDERLDMAQWFADVTVDAENTDADWFASMLSFWARKTEQASEKEPA